MRKKLLRIWSEFRFFKSVNVIFEDENTDTIWVDRMFMYEVPRRKDHIQRSKKYYIVDLVIFNYDTNTIIVSVKRF